MLQFRTANSPDGDYSRCDIAGCVLIPNSGNAAGTFIPLSVLKAIQSEYPVDAQVGFALGHASRLGVAAVIGTSETFRQLEAAALPACEEVQSQVEAALKMGLSLGAQRWLDSNLRSPVSDSVFQYLTGLDCVSNGSPEFPSGRSDVISLENMRKRVQEIGERFERVAELGKPWRELGARWNEIVALLHDGEQGASRLQRLLQDMVPDGSWGQAGVFQRRGVLQQVLFGKGVMKGFVKYTIDGKDFFVANHDEVKEDIAVGRTVIFMEYPMNLILGPAAIELPSTVRVVGVR